MIINSKVKNNENIKFISYSGKYPKPLSWTINS